MSDTLRHTVSTSYRDVTYTITVELGSPLALPEADYDAAVLKELAAAMQQVVHPGWVEGEDE
jgi:hypothetical protein